MTLEEMAGRAVYIRQLTTSQLRELQAKEQTRYEYIIDGKKYFQGGYYPPSDIRMMYEDNVKRLSDIKPDEARMVRLKVDGCRPSYYSKEEGDYLTQIEHIHAWDWAIMALPSLDISRAWGDI